MNEYYEMKYWELREEMDRQRDLRDWNEYDRAKERFLDFCADVLEALIEGNADILERLKNK